MYIVNVEYSLTLHGRVGGAKKLIIFMCYALLLYAINTIVKLYGMVVEEVPFTSQ